MSRRALGGPNLAALERFWRRASFHDETIEEVRAIHQRVVIRLARMSLVVTDVTHLQRPEEVPAVWLEVAITPQGDRFMLKIQTDAGPLKVTGSDVRLIRNADLAVLIPPVDN